MAVHEAAARGSLEVLPRLLQQCKQVDVLTSRGDSLLCIAAAEGAVESVEYLLERNAAVDHVNLEGLTALHHAARSANLLVVQALVGAGASLEAQDNTGHSPLHLAAARMSLQALDVVRALLDAKASANLLTSAGKSALDLAIESGLGGTVRLLEKASAPLLFRVIAAGDVAGVVSALGTDLASALTSFQGMQAVHQLHLAVAAPDVDVLMILAALIEAKADVTAQTSTGTTVLHTAATVGRTALAKALLDLKIDNEIFTDAQDEVGMTALHIAAFHGHSPIVQLLCEAGAHAALLNEVGENSLHGACRGEHTQVLKTLMRHAKEAGHAACGRLLHVASSTSFPAGVRLALQAKCDVDGVDEDDNTPLTSALQESDSEDSDDEEDRVRPRFEVVKMLLEAKADVFAVNSEGLDAMRLAKKGHHKRIKKLLMKATKNLHGGCGSY
jgi:ankyrin repeat protein